MIGQTVSHYKIIEKLGEGGMGVVYKAHDTQLDRDVALKFLPEKSIVSEEEKARFLREARAASAVAHPHVCVIYDIAEDQGKQFIAMEYIDGKTLKQKVPIGKIQDAIKYAIEIGEALEEAHSKGVVHRDVKTDNIMVNSKNQIKVMDFGLAKLKGSLKLTRTSSTVGTLAYMAPEQIQGGEVDARSDIFSFGVVLYEMLTGQLPFRAEHEAAMVYSIVNEEPEAIEKYRQDLSPEFLHIIHRALEKNPDDRYQSAHDMLIELRRLKRETSRVAGTAFGKAKDSRRTDQYRHRKISGKSLLLVSTIAAAVVLLALYLFVFRSGLPRPNPNMVTRVIDIPFSETSYPALSKDGNWIAFAAGDLRGKWDYYFMLIRTSELRRVTFDSLSFDNQFVDISPDGGQIVYDSRISPQTGIPGLYVLSPLTGEKRKLVDTAYTGIWRPDGERIGFMRFPGRCPSMSGKPEFWTIRPDGSDKRLEFVDTLSNKSLTLCPSWSPDGNSIAWLSTRKGTTQEIFIRNLRSRSERQLTRLNSAIDNMYWASNGWILFSSNKSGTTNLWMIPAEGGEPVQFTKGTNPYFDVRASRNCDRLLAYQRTQVNRLWVADIEGAAALPVTADDQLYSSPSFSPEDRRLVFSMSGGDPFAKIQHIYVMDQDGQRREQITSGGHLAQHPIWSPDGKWIAYASVPTEENPLPYTSEKSVGPFTATSDVSYKCYIVDASNPGPPKFVGSNKPLVWIDNESFLAKRGQTLSAWQTFVDGREQKRYCADSVIAFPVQSGKLLLVTDYRQQTQGLYVAPYDYLENPRQQKLRLIQGYKPTGIEWTAVPAPNGSFALICNSKFEFWKIRFPSGAKERLNRTFPEMEIPSFCISNDGKKIVYGSRIQTKSRLVLMENPFE
jgi:serine/threonine protein kinase